MDYDMIGPGIVLGLGCIGSSIGCGIMRLYASLAVMTRVEEGHGKFMLAFQRSPRPSRSTALC